MIGRPTYWPCNYCRRKDTPESSGRCRGCGSQREAVEIVEITIGNPRLKTVQFTKPRKQQ